MNKEEIDKIISGFDGQALGENVVIYKFFDKNVTETGLDVSSISDRNNKYKKGVVVSIGINVPDKFSEYVKVGSIVFFDNYKNSEFTQNAIDYSQTYYLDLLAVTN